MNCINLICAVLSLIATISIGIVQIKQSQRMNKLELQQKKKQYEEAVESKAQHFLIKYNSTRELVPLCAIAFKYDQSRVYSRDMYSDFRLLSKDVRLKIFEQCGWVMCDIQTDNFFNDCLDCLEKAFERFLTKRDFSRMFYENGKCLERSILRYATKKISYEDLGYENILTDILAVPFCKDERNDYDPNVIEKIANACNFWTCQESDACQIACLVAKYAAIYSRIHIYPNIEKIPDYGCPDDGSIETLEDLFLLTLFCIWSNLWPLKEEKRERGMLMLKVDS